MFSADYVHNNVVPNVVIEAALDLHDDDGE